MPKSAIKAANSISNPRTANGAPSRAAKFRLCIPSKAVKTALTGLVSGLAGSRRAFTHAGDVQADGSVPVVGDAADFFYKPNERNLRLLERDLARREDPARRGLSGGEKT